jgi:hypothetical protein
MSAPTTQPKAPAGRLTPPDEQFWQRYSPHHEFPLSTVTSVALHILVIALMLIGGWLLLRLGWQDPAAPVPVEAVRLPGGGGGSEKGVGGGPGVEGEPPPPEDVGEPDTKPDKTPQPPVSIKDINPEQFDPVVAPRVIDNEGRPVVNPAAEVQKRVGALKEDARKKIFGPLAGKGRGGSGEGGGLDKGKDTGTGRGEGDGKISARQKRVLRWVMLFNTQNGTDYARQLAALGAILAFPNPRDANEYLVIRDLSARPIAANVEDLSAINRIFWVDEKRQSVDSLARALGIEPMPPHFVAFFPEALEAKLLQMELKYENKPEDRIDETKFEIRRTAGGGYEPRVTSQRSH